MADKEKMMPGTKILVIELNVSVVFTDQLMIWFKSKIKKDYKFQMRLVR